MSFYLPSLSRFLLRRGAALDDAHDVGFLHDDEVLAIELDLGARPFAEQHAVARLDVERVQRAVLAAGARADGDDLAFHRLFLGGVGDDDAAGGLRLGFNATDQDTVLQGTEFHGCSWQRGQLSGVQRLAVSEWECQRRGPLNRRNSRQIQLLKAEKLTLPGESQKILALRAIEYLHARYLNHSKLCP